MFLLELAVLSGQMSKLSDNRGLQLLQWFSQDKHHCRVVLIRDQSLAYLSFCKHADIGGGFGRVIVFAVGENSAIQEGQIITGWMMQLHLRYEKRRKISHKSQTRV